MEWNGMEWNGMEWNGIIRPCGWYYLRNGGMARENRFTMRFR